MAVALLWTLIKELINQSPIRGKYVHIIQSVRYIYNENWRQQFEEHVRRFYVIQNTIIVCTWAILEESTLKRLSLR